MAHGKLKAGLILSLLVVIAMGSFMAYRWVSKAFGTAHATNAPAAAMPSGIPSVAGKDVTSAPMLSLPLVIKGTAMAEAFRSGHLPTPLLQPQGTPEQTAAELAKRVTAEDEQSTAALMTALQMSGLSIRGDDGSVAFESAKPGQGILIDAWEVAALAKLFGDGMETKLTDFSSSFASTIRPLKDAPVTELFLKGIRGAAQSDQTSLRFWADFIVELGRQSAQPYDLLAPDLKPEKVSLDAIQSSLILRRLFADLMVAQGNKTHKAEFLPAWNSNSLQRWTPASYYPKGGMVHNAVWHPGRGPRILLVDEGGGGSGQPCTLKELEAQILDVTAYTYTKAFDSLLDYLGEHAGMEGAEKYGKATSVANVILAIIKLYAYYACMETDITMKGEPPLVRTQSIYEAGERRTLVATVRENIGKWQALNCARIALNGANLDISLPNDGPVAGVATQWVFTSDGSNLTGGTITYPFVEFVSQEGTPHIQDATGPVNNATAPKTDEEGHTEIDIEGVKQREKLSSPMPIMKQAEVRFTVAAKAVSMSQDLIDAGGNTSGGLVGILVGGPVEMLLRSSIHMSKRLLIPVKDWNSCDGGWGGTISYASTFSYVHNDPVNRITDAKNSTMHTEVQLHGNENASPGWSGTSNGNFTASYNLNYRNTKTWPPASRPGMSFGGATVIGEENASATGAGDATVEISAQGNNKYEITSRTGTIQGVDLWHTTCTGDCRGKNEPDKNNSMSYSLNLSQITAQEDPDHPGVLRGSATLPPTMNGETLTANWNLTQCQDRR